MESLFEPGVNCLVFDRIGHQELTEEDVTECLREVKEHLKQLVDPVDNQRIGLAGYNRLREVMWSTDNPLDTEAFSNFMKRVFP